MHEFMLGFSEYLRSGRDQNRDIRPIFAVPFVSLPMAASLSLKDSLILKVKQSVHAIGAFDVNISSFAAIASAGSAFGNRFFSAKGKATIPTASSYNLNFCAIDKQGLSLATSSTVAV